MESTTDRVQDLEQEREALIAQAMSAVPTGVRDTISRISVSALQRVEVHLTVSHEGTNADAK